MSTNKAYLEATRKELESWPDTSLEIDNTGKHNKVTLHYKGQSHFVIMAATPSDARGLQNHIATVRRTLRGLGAAKYVAPPREAIKPAQHKPFQELENMTQPQVKKIESILQAISELRYGEMLQLAEVLADAAVVQRLKRSDVAGWATLLHGVSV